MFPDACRPRPDNPININALAGVISAMSTIDGRVFDNLEVCRPITCPITPLPPTLLPTYLTALHNPININAFLGLILTIPTIMEGSLITYLFNNLYIKVYCEKKMPVFFSFQNLNLTWETYKKLTRRR